MKKQQVKKRVTPFYVDDYVQPEASPLLDSSISSKTNKEALNTSRQHKNPFSDLPSVQLGKAIGKEGIGSIFSNNNDTTNESLLATTTRDNSLNKRQSKNYNSINPIDNVEPRRTTRIQAATLLETIGSRQIWIVILLPILLAILSIILPMVYTENDVVSLHHCPSTMTCSSGPSWLHIVMDRTINDLDFIKVRLHLDSLPKQHNSNDSPSNDSPSNDSPSNDSPSNDSPNDNDNINNTNSNITMTMTKDNAIINLKIGLLQYNDNNENSNIKYIDSIDINPDLYMNHCLVNPSSLKCARDYDIPLLYYSFESPDIIHAAKQYMSINITIDGLLSSSLLSSSSFFVASENSLFLWLSPLLILIMATTAMVVFITYIWRIVVHVRTNNSNPKHWLELILPEQINGMIMCLLLIMWLEPLSITKHLFGLLSVNIPDVYIFASKFIASIARQALLFSVLVFTEGLQFDNISNQNTNTNAKLQSNSPIFGDSNKRRKSRRTAFDWITNDTTATRSDTDSLLLSQSYQYLNKCTVCPHHPLSPLFCDFIYNKLLLLFLSMIISFLFWTTKFPSLATKKWVTATQDERMIVYFLSSSLGFVLFLIDLLWVYYIHNSVRTTGKMLRRTKHLTSRYRQMIFRLLVNQITLGVIVLTILFAKELSSLAKYVKCENLSFFERIDVLIDVFYFGFIAPFSFGGVRLCLLTFVICICFLLSISSLPPRLSNINNINFEGTSHNYVALERHMPYQHLEKLPNHIETSGSILESLMNIANNRKSFNKRVRRDIFCLETACLLLEASFQCYFKKAAVSRPTSAMNTPNRINYSKNTKKDKPKAGNPFDDVNDVEAELSQVVGPNMDLARLGLELFRTFESDDQQIFGMIARADDRIVVTFRGSNSYDNIVTDFKFHQRELPNLKNSRKYFMHAGSRELLNRSTSSPTFDSKGASYSLFHDFKASPNDDIQIMSDLLSPVTDTDSSPRAFSDLAESSDSLGISRENIYNLNSDSQIFISQINDDIIDIEHKESYLDYVKKLVSKLPVFEHAIPRVHEGFLTAYMSIRTQFLSSLLIALLEHRKNYYRCLRFSKPESSSDLSEVGYRMPNDLKLFFCGHSLGAALAVFATLDYTLNKDSMNYAIKRLDEFSKHYEENILTNKEQVFREAQVTLYTYGSPRVGNTAFSNLLNRKIRNYYRIELDGDIVTMIPPYFSFIGFYSHAGVQVVVDSEGAGNMIVKPLIIESILLSSATTSIGNHDLNLYRVCIEKCFDKSELQEYLDKEKNNLSFIYMM